MKFVRQKHLKGCAVATFAMLTELSYDEAYDRLVGAEHNLHSDGMSFFILDHQFAELGFAVARKFRTLQPDNQKRVVWPVEPFADWHWCEVITFGNTAHAIVMDQHGVVYDPDCDVRKTLADYKEVLSIAAVVKIK